MLSNNINLFKPKILKFYENGIRNHDGLTINDMHNFTYEQLEEGHSYIQWMFPTKESSRVNSTAPILRTKDIQYIQNNNTIKQNMKKSIMVFTDFLGLNKDYAEGKYYVKNSRIELWLTPYNHNYLRITRMLESTILFGFSEDAVLLFQCLSKIRNRGYREVIGNSYQYWEEVIKDVKAYGN
jgi:hypothetical protein